MYPHERSLVQRLATSPFALIGVNSDPMEKVQEALVRENITWRSFFNGGSTRGPISGAWGVTGWPTIYVLDHEGVIRFKNVRGAAMDKAVDELLGPAMAAVVANLRSEDAAVRGLAAFRMGLYNAPDAVTAISGLLQDADATVQQRTATALALLGQPVGPLLPQIRAAVADADPEVRAAGLQVLAAAKDPECITIALQALNDGQVPVVLAALRALASTGDPRSVPAVVTVLERPVSRVAREAANALALMNTPESRQALLELAGKADHPARAWIAVALYQVEAAAGAARISALFADKQDVVRRQIARAAKDLAALDATDEFIGALQDQDAQVRKMAREYLAKSDQTHAREALQTYLVAQIEKYLPQLTDRDAKVSAAARSQLADLGAEGAPLLLERLLQAENPSLIATLAQLVGAGRNPVVVPTLLEQIRSADLAENRRDAYENSLQFFADDLFSDLRALVKSDAAPLRLSGVRLLPGVDNEEVTPLLKDALRDADLRVRSYAACALARTKDPDALVLIKDATTNTSDRALQRSAVQALMPYGEETSLPILLALMAGDDRGVRPTAFLLLANFPKPEVTKQVIEMAAADPTLRSLAPNVLYRHANADAARALGEYLNDADPKMRPQLQGMLRSMKNVPEARAILDEFKKKQAAEKAAAKAKGEGEKAAQDKPAGESAKK